MARRRSRPEVQGGDSKAAPTRKFEELTQEEVRREIWDTINEARSKVPAKLMTIDSFGPDGNRRGRRTKKKAELAPAPPPPPSLAPEDLGKIREAQAREFERLKWRLVLDHVFLSLLGACGCWGLLSVKATTSYGLGALFGTMYLVLLGRFVESLGGGAGQGAGGGGPARLGLVVALVLLCGKNREVLEVVPAVAGFLTYQLATLAQGLYPEEEQA